LLGEGRRLRLGIRQDRRATSDPGIDTARGGSRVVRAIQRATSGRSGQGRPMIAGSLNRFTRNGSTSGRRIRSAQIEQHDRDAPGGSRHS
jgi:hypothetical protein